MAKVDELVIELRAKTGQFDAAMNKAGKTTRDFEVIAKRAALAVVAAGGAIAAIAKKATDMAGKMKDLSLETGIAATTFSALQTPLENSGSSVDEFASSVVRMSRAISEAALGENKQLAATFEELGLSIESLRASSPEEQLNAITEALAKVEDQGDLTRLGVDIFGRSFSGLIPVIKETKGSLNDYTEAAQEAGNALTQEQIDTLDDFGDALNTLSISISNYIGGSFADFLQWLGDVQESSRTTTMTIEALGRAQARVQADIDAYTQKAKAAGFVTEARAPSSGEFVGPAMPARKRESSGSYRVATQREQIKNNKELIQQDAQIIAYNEHLKELERDRQRQAEQLGAAFTNAFEDAVLGAESFGDALGALGNQIEKILFNRLVSQPLTDIVGGIADRAMGGGSIGDLLGSLFDGFRAGGGSVQSGGAYVVGEKRPEIFVPHTSGRIVPSTSGMGGGGNVQVNVINNASAQVRTESNKNSSGGVDIKILIDEAVANNIGTRGSKTSQALQSFSSQSTVRR
jgi:hypothetical protein